MFDVKLITLTPLVMRGVDKGRVEFRLQEIKGLLRYWYRIRHFDMWDRKLRELKEREDRIFGSTKSGSKVWLWGNVEGRVMGWNYIYRRDKDQKLYRDQRDHKWLNKRIWNKDESMPLVSNSPFWMGVRYAYPRDTKIHLEIGLKDLNEEQKEEFWKTLWALVYVGGLGYRWRRGLGNVSLVVEESDIPYEYVEYFDVHLAEDMCSFYQNGMNWVGLDKFIVWKSFSVQRDNLPSAVKDALKMTKYCYTRNDRNNDRKNDRKVAVSWIRLWDISDKTYMFVLFSAIGIYKGIGDILMCSGDSRKKKHKSNNKKSNFKKGGKSRRKGGRRNNERRK